MLQALIAGRLCLLTLLFSSDPQVADTRGAGHMPFDRFPVAHYFHPRQYHPTQTQNATLAIVHLFAYVRANFTGRNLSRQVGFLGLLGKKSIHPTDDHPWLHV
jgi:hypothetical protein